MKSKSEIQGDALSKLLPHKRAGAGIATGGGKTLLGLKHMNQNYNEFASFLVIAPKRSIFKEWHDQAVQHNLSHLLPHITFSTYRSLDAQSLEHDVLYLDECHSLLYSHDKWLMAFSGKIIGLTGTPPKYPTSEKGKMVDKYCPIVYEYKTDEAIDDKILNDYSIIIHKLRLDTGKTMRVEGKTGNAWYTSERANYDYWTNRLESSSSPKEIQIIRVMRMKALMTFPSKERLVHKLLNEINDKVIVFANTQEQADSFNIPSYHSNNSQSEKNLDDFKKGDLMQLAAVLQLSEGINIPNLKQGIIMHSYGNERKLAQRLGRLLRLNPKEKSIIHILCYENSIDETWVRAALESFEPNKILWVASAI